MTEVSYFWDGSTGDGGSYGHAEMMDTLFYALTGQSWAALYAWDEYQGVLKGWLGELAVTGLAAANATVATGAAMAHGMFYENDAAVAVAPADPSGYVVIRRTWVPQQVRAAWTTAITQTYGTTWDIPLARVTFAGGVITGLTDWRVFCTFSTDMLDGAVTTAALADDSVTTDALANQTRWVAKAGGALRADADTPATWTYQSGGFWAAYAPFFTDWRFSASAYNSVWLTTKVPEDFLGTTATVWLWLTPNRKSWGGTDDAVFGWTAWRGISGGAFSSVGNSLTVSMPLRQNYVYRVNAGTITGLTANSLVHMEVYRDGAAVADGMVDPVALRQVELSYSADS